MSHVKVKTVQLFDDENTAIFPSRQKKTVFKKGVELHQLAVSDFDCISNEIVVSAGSNNNNRKQSPTARRLPPSPYYPGA